MTAAEPLTVPTPVVPGPGAGGAVPAPRPAPDHLVAPGRRPSSGSAGNREPRATPPAATRPRTPATHRGPLGHGAGVRLRPGRATFLDARPPTRHARAPRSPDPSGPAVRGRRRGAAPLALLVAAVLAASTVVAVLRPLAPAAATEPPPAAAPADVVRATTVTIPALGVRGPLVDLGVDAAGTLLPPATADVAGWFTGSAAPGRPGPTVLAGHTGSPAGPGAFLRLRELRRGDVVDVGRSDGVTVRYRVTAVRTVDSTTPPAPDVHGPAPELRLVSYGGSSDRSARGSPADVIVFAVAA